MLENIIEENEQEIQETSRSLPEAMKIPFFSSLGIRKHGDHEVNRATSQNPVPVSRCDGFGFGQNSANYRVRSDSVISNQNAYLEKLWGETPRNSDTEEPNKIIENQVQKAIKRRRNTVIPKETRVTKNGPKTNATNQSGKQPAVKLMKVEVILKKTSLNKELLREFSKNYPNEKQGNIGEMMIKKKRGRPAKKNK